MTVAMGHPSVKSASPPGHGKDRTQTRRGLCLRPYCSCG